MAFKMKKTLSSGVLALSFLLAATEPMDKIADWNGQTKNLGILADGVIEAKGYTTIFGSKMIDFSPDKKFCLQGEFRKSGGSGDARLFFGFQTFDKDGKAFHSTHVRAIPDTDTELVANAFPGSLELKLKDASKWQAKTARIFHDTDPSYSDLPNHNELPNVIESITQVDGVWVVKLKTPLAAGLKVGTRVRQHFPGGAMYAAAKELTSEWEKFTWVAAGQLDNPGFSYRIFPVGTSKVRVLLFLNHGSADAVTEFRNITFHAE